MDFCSRPLIRDDEFCGDQEDLLDKYKPLGEAITRLQGYHINVADIMHAYKSLMVKYGDPDYQYSDQEVVECLQKEWELIEDDMHHACYLADPRYLSEVF